MEGQYVYENMHKIIGAIKDTNKLLENTNSLINHIISSINFRSNIQYVRGCRIVNGDIEQFDKGIFYGFSTNSVLTKDGYKYYTVAIVELEDGSVVLVPAESVAFIKVVQEV